MREALLRKRYGIPLIILVAIVIGAGIAVAALTCVYRGIPTVQWPVSENATKSFTVASGHSFSEENWLDMNLPDNYNLKYELIYSTTDNLENENAVITLDLNDDRILDANENENYRMTIDTTTATKTFNGIGPGQIAQYIVISADAKDNALMTTTWVSGNNDPTYSDPATELKVRMVPIPV